MTRKILLDTNLIIAAFDSKDPAAIEQLTQLLSDDKVAFAISPLIRYEVLRGVHFADDEKHHALNEVLNGFEEFDIGKDIANLSSTLFRFARSKQTVGKKTLVDKRSFDVFHYATAQCNELELCSNDNDLKKLEQLYQDWIVEDEKKED